MLNPTPTASPEGRAIFTGRLPLAQSPAGEAIATIFTVWPAGDSWRLQGEELEPLLFLSGVDAERQGRRLALALARLGQDTRVNIYDRRKRLVGAIGYFGSQGLGSPDAGGYPWTP